MPGAQVPGAAGATMAWGGDQGWAAGEPLDLRSASQRSALSWKMHLVRWVGCSENLVDLVGSVGW